MEIRGRLLVERASTLPPSTSPPWFDVADAFDGVDGSDAPTTPNDASADVSELYLRLESLRLWSFALAPRRGTFRSRARCTRRRPTEATSARGARWRR